eukprot:4927454-Amphidinium_carterae.1
MVACRQLPTLQLMGAKIGEELRSWVRRRPDVLACICRGDNVWDGMREKVCCEIVDLVGKILNVTDLALRGGWRPQLVQQAF